MEQHLDRSPPVVQLLPISTGDVVIVHLEMNVLAICIERRLDSEASGRTAVGHDLHLRAPAASAHVRTSLREQGFAGRFELPYVTLAQAVKIEEREQERLCGSFLALAAARRAGELHGGPGPAVEMNHQRLPEVAHQPQRRL